MGVTIHYSGELKEATQLQSLIEEVRDIAVIKDWHYYNFENQFENNTFSEEAGLDKLFGIVVVPKDCEPLCLSFLSNGKLCGLLNFKIITEDQAIEEDLAYSLFIKTQNAGVETHKDVILFLDYISDKYFIDFKCYDEGEFWETRDEDALLNIFERHDAYIEKFESALKMIPPTEGESIEQHVIRLANTTNDAVQNSDAELSNLSIEEENEFKRMKINLEHGGFFGGDDANIPPEIEAHFLDHIIEFEKQFKDAKRITVYEKIGKPNFSKSIDLSTEELKEALENLFELLEQNNIFLEVFYDYDNETMLIYDFITQELFSKEVDDIAIAGMMTNFTYEEFHPNHQEDLQHDSYDFWSSYFKNDSEQFDEFTLGDLLNSEEMNDFRYAFEAFKNLEINVLSSNFDLKKGKASTRVHLKFDALIDAQDRIEFDCDSIMSFNYHDGFWYLSEVTLPEKK